MSRKRQPDTTRRSWNKIPMPPHYWELLHTIARRHGERDERDLWRFLLRLVRERYPDEWADALKGHGVTDAELDG